MLKIPNLTKRQKKIANLLDEYLGLIGFIVLAQTIVYEILFISFLSTKTLFFLLLLFPVLFIYKLSKEEVSFLKKSAKNLNFSKQLNSISFLYLVLLSMFYSASNGSLIIENQSQSYIFIIAIITFLITTIFDKHCCKKN